MRVKKQKAAASCSALPPGAAAYDGGLNGSARASRVQVALQRGEWRICTRIEDTPDFIACFDRELRHLYASPALEEAAGYPAGAFLGKTSRELGLKPELVELWDQALRRVFETAEKGELEFACHGSQGERYYHFRIVPEFESDGSVGAVVGITRDVTAEKRAEATPQLNAERHRMVLRATNDVIWDWDLVGNQAYWSQNLTTLLGHAAEEAALDLEWWANAIHPEDHERVKSGLQAFLSGSEEQWVEEYRFRRGDGSYATVLGRGHVARDTAGTPVRMIGSMMDISERKAAEQALRSAEEQVTRMRERMRALAAAASGVIGAPTFRALQEVVREACQRVVSLDAFILSLYDPTTDALTFLGSYDSGILTPAETLPLVGSPNEPVVRGRRSVLTHTSADPRSAGAKRVITMHRLESVIRTPILAGEEVLGVISAQSYTPHLYGEQDVEVLEALAALAASAILNIRLLSERHAAEDRLHTSAQYFRALIEQGDDLITVLAADGTIQYQSPSTERVLGRPLETRFGCSPFEYIHPEDVERSRQMLAQLLQAPGTTRRVEYRVRHATDSWRVLESIATNQLHDPVVGGVVINSRDVTERRQIEAAVRESAARFQSLIKSTADMLSVLGPDGTILYTSPSIETLYGYKPEEVAGRKCYEYIHADDVDAVHDALERIVGQRSTTAPSLQFRFRHRDGTWHVVESIASNQLEDSEVRGVVINSRDITCRRTVDEARTRLSRILEATTDFVATVDARGSLLYLNRAGRRMLGLAETGDLPATELTSWAPVWAVERMRDEAFPAALREGSWSGETALLTADGQEVDVSQVVLVHRRDDGTIDYYSSIARDIGERKRAEEALRQSQERLQLLLKQTPAVLWTTDAQLRFTMGRGAGLNRLGYADDSVLDVNVYEFFQAASDDHPVVEAHLGALAGEGLHYEYEWQGAVFDSYVQPFRNAAGEIRGVIGLAVDISERRETEAMLRRQALLFDSLLDGVLIKDHEGRITDWNPAAERIFGFTREEAIGSSPQIFHHPAIRETLEAEILATALRDGRWQGDVRFQRKDGSEGIAESIVAVQRDVQERPLAFVGVNRDVTESRRVEEARRESAARLQAIVAAAVDGIITIDGHGVIDSINPAAERIFGYAAEEVLGRNISMLMPEPYRSQHPGYLERLQRTGERRIIGAGREVRGRRKDGSEFPLELAVNETSLAGRCLFTGIVRDITERKQAEERIRFQAHLLDTVGQAVIATDLQGRILYWNQAAEALYGWSAEETLGRNIVEITPSETTREQAAEIMERLSAGQSWSGEFLVRRRDGSSFPALVTDTPIHNQQGEMIGLVGISSDESARRQLEAQFRQAQKMEAVGRLAGGVAHDFNNLLTAINGSATFLLSDLEPGHPSRVDAEGIQRAAMRAAGLIRQLLAFSRKQVLQPRVLDVNAHLGEMFKMLSRVIGEDVRLVTIVAGQPLLVRADPVQLEQVVLNLCVNSRDAMPSGGILTIETSQRDISAEQVAQLPFPIPLGGYVQLSVSDNGHGMDEEVLQHLFEPFFTTKGPGKGTGLGLPTVYGIVKQSEGYIDVRSKVGEGTTVTILLPRLLEAEGAAPAAELEAELPRGSGTLLLVEDEEIVRCNTRRVLERNGYTVLEAESGDEAIRIFAACPVPIDLLIADVVMPGLNGVEVAQRLRLQRPELPVIYMSGYADERIEQHGLNEGEEVVLLEKPFQPSLLLRTVHHMLCAGAASAAAGTRE